MATKTVARRVQDEAAFVLQTWPWKETSLLVELMTLHHGKVVVVARGAKRPGSQFRGLLSSFIPLKVSYHGQNEVKSLSKVQWLGGYLPLEGEALFAGFYVNELLVRLLPREDAMPALFASYVQALKALAGDSTIHERALRIFEGVLLEDLGYGLPDEMKAWVWQAGEMLPWTANGLYADDAIVIDAPMLAKLKKKDFTESATLAFAKKLYRSMIAHYVGDKPLNTRRIMQELRRL